MAITKTIQPGDKKKLAPQELGVYRFQVKQGKVRFADNRAEVRNGDLGVPGDRGRIEMEKGDYIWVKNVGLNDAKVELNQQGLKIEFFPNSKLEVTDKVFPGVEADKVEASSNNETLTFKDQSVPEGSKVYIYPDSGNNGKGLVEGVAPIGGGQSFAISNMSNISLEATSSGDKFYAVAEVDQ